MFLALPRRDSKIRCLIICNQTSDLYYYYQHDSTILFVSHAIMTNTDFDIMPIFQQLF